MPVVFDDCCGSTNKPNRVLRVRRHPASGGAAGRCMAAIEERCRCKEACNCHEMWKQIPGDCTSSGQVCCIPLAVIRDYTYCEALTEVMIDNSIRPVMPSAPRLEDLIHCLMDQLPKSGPRLTHIARFGWEHDREYAHGEFIRDFVGSPEAPHGFEIEFDRGFIPRV